jgi:hypothetical protein
VEALGEGTTGTLRITSRERRVPAAVSVNETFLDPFPDPKIVTILQHLPENQLHNDQNRRKKVEHPLVTSMVSLRQRSAAPLSTSCSVGVGGESGSGLGMPKQGPAGGLDGEPILLVQFWRSQ